jgi:predicted sugar kinase
MKTLVVLEGNCGDEGIAYKNWLEKNLPDDIELDFRSGCSGVGGGLFDDDGNVIDGGSNEWWAAYCNS